MSRRPPKGKRLLVLATTALKPALTELQMTEMFDAELRVPAISSLNSLEHVLKEVELFRDGRELKRAISLLSNAGFGQGDDYDRLKMTVGVKKLLSIVEMARQEPEEVAERLVSGIMALNA
jgi:vesicle-fusing ATPase